MTQGAGEGAGAALAHDLDDAGVDEGAAVYNTQAVQYVCHAPDESQSQRPACYVRVTCRGALGEQKAAIPGPGGSGIAVGGFDRLNQRAR